VGVGVGAGACAGAGPAGDLERMKFAHAWTAVGNGGGVSSAPMMAESLYSALDWSAVALSRRSICLTVPSSPADRNTPATGAARLVTSACVTPRRCRERGNALCEMVETLLTFSLCT
jgi:hypothetical protein